MYNMSRHGVNKLKSMSSIQKFRVRDGGGEVSPTQSFPKTANEKQL